jgi:hypothetical protein
MTMNREGAGWKAAIPMCLGAIAALSLAAVPASAQSNCKWYAATALKQQQQNEKLGCKFSGPEWHTDLRRHMAWCNSVPPDVWKSSAQKRDQDLATCARSR